ncbi:MAG: hypothetical protein ACRC46_11455, partial [Thermoguttaceae bacterium]
AAISITGGKRYSAQPPVRDKRNCASQRDATKISVVGLQGRVLQTHRNFGRVTGGCVCRYRGCTYRRLLKWMPRRGKYGNAADSLNIYQTSRIQFSTKEISHENE